MGQELRDYKVHGSLKFATFPLSFLLRILNICAEHAANGQVEALLMRATCIIISGLKHGKLDIQLE
ncbi:uncharacterized protein LOC141864448 isoform X6 [Acropora palmata]|uniref:uncharacterized protein LOC141864448 isoform X6 n=1 Tax=Acropora palmata TaxID=6131 RepID=UPI003DA1BAA7